jgi:HTH-type transcriptional regulator, competence development regulator
MAMRFERSKEWWLARLAGETNVPIGAAGGLADPADGQEPADPLPTTWFGEFVHLLRRRECLSVDQFAETVDIELSDAQAIEEDPFYRVDFRTVWAISRRFGLPQAKLNEMAGVAVANDVEPYIDQRRYAARSELRSALSADEMALLDIVVAVIDERAKG